MASMNRQSSNGGQINQTTTNTTKKPFAQIVSSYVPSNERTFNYAIPTFAFSFSCFSFGCLMRIIDHWYPQKISEANLFTLGYLTLAAASNVELYYGLTHRSRRQFSFWILFKLIEMLILLGVTVKHHISYEYYQHILWPSYVLCLLNFLLLTYVIKRSTRRGRKSLETPDNVDNDRITIDVY